MEKKSKEKEMYNRIKTNFLSVNFDLKIQNNEIEFPAFIDYYLQGFYSFSDISKFEDMGIKIKFIKQNENIFSKFKEEISIEEFIVKLLNRLLFLTNNDIIEIIKKSPINWEITPANIPQFSNFKDGTINLIKILNKEKHGFVAKEIGKNLSSASKTEEADRKYGENHGKLAGVLDIVYSKNNNYYLTSLGKQLIDIPEEIQEEIFKKTIFNIPIVKKIILEDKEKINIKLILSNYLSDSTAKRRSINIQKLLTIIMNK